ncbi:MAG TPA: ATP-binding protein [Sandaracinaceae bacterium LLY-WYZ-13_1]|nr:ATP-binding protein [Sandaracinaceae bacterium LLY-WYZ-13_1]
MRSIPRRETWAWRVGGLLAIGLILALGAWCWDLIADVTRLRSELSARVETLIALQRAGARVEGVGEDPGAFAALEDAVDAMERAGAAEPELVASIRDARAAAQAGDEPTALAGFDAAVSGLRRANAGTSRTLGERWDSLYGLAVVALALALVILVLLALSRRLLGRLREAEARLRSRLERTQEDFRAMIEASPDGVLLLRDGHVAYANPRMAAILDLPEGALEGRALTDLMAADEALGEGERRFVRRSGEVRQLELTRAAPTELAGAEAELWVARDVSDRRMLEAQLRLADRLAAVGAVAAGVAHEINNPLTYILSNADALAQQLDAREAPPPGAPLRRMIDDIREGAHRVGDVVKGLRTMSHPSDEDVSPVELGPVVESSLAIARSDLSQRARVSLSLPDDLPPVRANPARLGQVFLNVLVNAAQALEEHGRRGHLEVRASRRGEWVEVRVRDDGPGIPEHARSRVFEPFFTTKPVGRGTGLGLAISRQIVEGVGGKMEIESRPGEGTEVLICLRPAEGRPSREPATAASDGAGRAVRVLIVDDDERVARSLRRMLREHEVDVAVGGRAGLEHLEREDYDVVFCDLMMPDVTGMDVHAHLRDEGRGREDRLVFVTGGAFTSAARAFVASIDNLVVEKPFSAESVRRVVRERAAVNAT